MEPIYQASRTVKPVPAINLQIGVGVPVAMTSGLKLTYAFLKTSKDFIN